MLETSTYGISDGSLFTSLGSSNTFQASPQILRANSNYTSAVFHGNVGSFWNRNDVYKNMGYNYFFDKNYFSQESGDSSGYGLKDKLFFAESVKYLERMQQPSMPSSSQSPTTRLLNWPRLTRIQTSRPAQPVT